MQKASEKKADPHYEWITHRYYQEVLLPGVSRTFALTIPELPAELRDTVTNAYLLCRIADTLEDHSALPADEKRDLFLALTHAIRGDEPAAELAKRMEAAVIAFAPVAERDLVSALERVVAVTHGLPDAHRIAVTRCVTVMGEGMARFQETKSPTGLPNRAAFDDYCYRVAGVVGEMLTDLFCMEIPEMEERRGDLMPLGRDFGLGLQATNILKDVWSDRENGVCWLPRDVFEAAGCQLEEDGDWHADPAFRAGMRQCVGLAAGRLDSARDYILAVPRRETGIRRFCAWAATMAYATLRRIHRRPGFNHTEQVKIPRRQVRRLARWSARGAKRDWIMRGVLTVSGRWLPRPPQE